MTLLGDVFEALIRARQRTEMMAPMSTTPDRTGDRADDQAWVIYSTVAARRLQWDNLVWQTPALSLTAQAFLLTITLSADYSVGPRRVAAVLALAVSLMSMNLLARHRLSELADAHFLEEFESRHARWLESFRVDEEGPDAGTVGRIHGKAFKRRRDLVLGQKKDGPMMAFAARMPSGQLWFYGLGLFGLAAVTVLFGSFAEWDWIFPPSR